MDKKANTLRPAITTEDLLARTRAIRAQKTKKKNRGGVRFDIDMKNLQHTFIAQGKMLRLLHLLTILSDGRHTIAEIAEQLNQRPRTVYRYINILEALEIPVDKDLHGKYFLASDVCPLCGCEKGVHHG